MVVGHSVPGYWSALVYPNANRHQARSTERVLAHFFRRFDPKQSQARGENCDDPLHQSEPGLRRVWIILDNEA
jgi:hypothetical protein